MKTLYITGAASVGLVAADVVIYLQGGNNGLFDLRRVRVRAGAGRDA